MVGVSRADSADRPEAVYDPDRHGAFSAWLRDRSDWEAATRHRFVEAYRDGDLADAVFERYLIQDYQFLEAGARVTALAASQAHTMDEMGRLSDSLAVLTGGENDYFQRAFDELGVPDSRRSDPDLHPTTATFIDFMYRAAHEGAYEETLAFIAAAERVYLDWCTYAADGDLDRWYLDEWVEIHVIDEFEEYTVWLCAQLDTYGPDLSPARQRRVAEVFERTVDLEAAFFDAAYE